MLGSHGQDQVGPTHDVARDLSGAVVLEVPPAGELFGHGRVDGVVHQGVDTGGAELQPGRGVVVGDDIGVGGAADVGRAHEQDAVGAHPDGLLGVLPIGGRLRARNGAGAREVVTELQPGVAGPEAGGLDLLQRQDVAGGREVARDGIGGYRTQVPEVPIDDLEDATRHVAPTGDPAVPRDVVGAGSRAAVEQVENTGGQVLGERDAAMAISHDVAALAPPRGGHQVLQETLAPADHPSGANDQVTGEARGYHLAGGQ